MTGFFIFKCYLKRYHVKLNWNKCQFICHFWCSNFIIGSTFYLPWLGVQITKYYYSVPTVVFLWEFLCNVFKINTYKRMPKLTYTTIRSQSEVRPTPPSAPRPAHLRKLSESRASEAGSPVVAPTFILPKPVNRHLKTNLRCHNYLLTYFYTSQWLSSQPVISS